MQEKEINVSRENKGPITARENTLYPPLLIILLNKRGYFEVFSVLNQ